MSETADGRTELLFVGDDWAEGHHDVELMNAAGRRLAKARLPEGVAGIARLHAMIGAQLGDAEATEVAVGIETDRGPWVAALIAAGYTRVRGEPVAGGAVSGTAQRLRRQERRRRRAHPGRHGAHRRPPTASGRRVTAPTPKR